MINLDNSKVIKRRQAERDLRRLVRNHTDLLLSVFNIAPEGTGLISLFGTGMEFTNKDALRVWIREALHQDPGCISLSRLRDMLEKELTSFSQGDCGF